MNVLDAIAHKPPPRCARLLPFAVPWLLLLGLIWTGTGHAAPGLTATYFNNMTLTAPAVVTRIDNTVNFNWGTGSPAGGIAVDNFSVRWTGFVRVLTTGSYTFQTNSDDGVRLWVNGAQLINNWTDHAPVLNNSAAVNLTAGVDYPVTMEFYERGGGAVAQLRWKKPGDTVFSAIPASDGTQGLSTTADGVLLARYRFNESAWSGMAGELLDTAGSVGGPFNGRGQGSTFAKPALANPARFSAIVGGGEIGTCAYATVAGSQADVAPFNVSGLTVWTTAGAQTSVAFWMYWNGNADDQVLSFGNYSLRFWGNSNIGFSTGNNDLYGLGISSLGNGWHHVVAVFTNGSVTANQLYIDNVLQNLTQRAGTPLLANAVVSANLHFGGTQSASGRFRGRLDELNVYNHTLSSTQVASLYAQTQPCAASLIAAYQFEEASYAGVAGELKDTAGYGAGPFDGAGQGSPLPAVATATPARPGGTGTCGYARLPGPINNGGGFLVNGLPLSTNTGAQTSVSFWMYWNGIENTMPVGWQLHDLWFTSGSFGFNTAQGDVFGMASAGLSGGWHHVVAVFNNGSVTGNKLYIDGVLQSLSQRAGSPSGASAVVGSGLRIGGWGANTSYRYSGLIDELKVYGGEVSAAQVASLYAETHTCPVQPLHHVEIQHGSGRGLTCSATSFTVKACMDAACATPYTGGVTGTLAASGTGMSVLWPAGTSFTIPSGSSTTNLAFQQTTVGSTLLSASGITPTPANATSCNFNTINPGCTFTAADSGLLFDVPNHRSEVRQALTVSAVKKADNSLACVPAFASVSRNVTLTCSYANPSSGTLPVRVASTALNAAGNAGAACDVGGKALSLAFDANGTASTTLTYADAGQVTLSARYAGSAGTNDIGLVLVGSDNFVATPTDFAVTGVPNSPMAAGSAFPVTVTARNSAGSTTPNFGGESVAEGAVLAFARTQPTGSSAVDGSFSGTLGGFNAGVATGSDLAWTEVGQGLVTATLTSASYLGSGMTLTGSATATFKPHHFDATTTAACGTFSYAWQPFVVTVTARNAAGNTTLNYDGSVNTSPNFAKAVTLSDGSANATGTLRDPSLAAGAFVNGVGSTSGSPYFAVTDKRTSPQSITLRATDADGVTSTGFAEGSMALRSGRLRLSNAFGRAKAPLQVPVVAEHWLDQAWVANTADHCTVVPSAAIALSNPRNASGGVSAATTSAAGFALTAGRGTLSLAAPAPAGSSLSLDLAINLGDTSADQSCLANHPTTTGARLPWLRSLNGACSAAANRDPAARATFGIYSPETRRTVHVRDLF